MSWRQELRIAAVEEAQKLGLTAREFDTLCAVLKRTPNYVELGVFSAMWSEHCSYKTSKSFLKKLPTTGSQVAVGPGENAGAIWIDNKYVAVFKMESHNHPSAIEPFQGAATGVGGILRDVFTMGARPIAVADVLFFGDRKVNPTSYLFHGVVDGIAFYGNCMGIPNVCGQTTFEPAYQDNILVNAMTVGIAEKEKLFFGTAAGVGNLVIAFGNSTGPDGVHGASMASQSFDSSQERPRPAVQVADPFKEKVLLEATLELMQSGAVVGIQDMGAAGLVSSSVEMAQRAETGVRLDLEKLPVRMTGDRVVTPFERLLSESQERMLMVVTPDNLSKVRAILDKWELKWAVMGEVTNTGMWECRFEGETVCKLPLEAVAVAAPPRATERKARPFVATAPRLVKEFTLSETLKDLKTFCQSDAWISRRPVYEHYDHMVGLRTILGPGHNAGVLRLHADEGPPDTTISVTAGVRSDWCALDPFLGTAWNLLHHVQKHRAVGSTARGVTDCLCFGNPEKPEILWQFEQCIEGLASACKELQTPVVSGNVSLYNATDGRDIPPTPSLGVVGVGRLGKHTPSFFDQVGQNIIHLRTTAEPTLAGSHWVRLKGGSLPLPAIDWEQERALLAALTHLQDRGLLSVVRTVGQGGLLGTLTTMAFCDASFGEGRVRGVVMDGKFLHRLTQESAEKRSAILWGEVGAGFVFCLNNGVTVENLRIELTRWNRTLTWELIGATTDRHELRFNADRFELDAIKEMTMRGLTP